MAATAFSQKRRDMEEELTRQQEQIRALKAQIATYQRMAAEEQPTAVRPLSQGVSLPPLHQGREGLNSRGSVRGSSRVATGGVQHQVQS